MTEVREITQSELAPCMALLESHWRDAMFPLSNLSQYGLINGPNPHPRASRVHAIVEGEEAVAVLTQTQSGGVFPCFGSLGARVAPLFKPYIAHRIVAAIGQKSEVRALLATCSDLPQVQLDDDDPQLSLDLSRLNAPDLHGYTLSPITKELKSLIIDWRAAFMIEAMSYPSDIAKTDAAKQVAGYITQDTHRVLLQSGKPVAICGFNACYRGFVQLGGIYTPPAHRGAGHASAAVAMHLQEAHGAGVTHAVLSAATEKAARMYQRLGFERCGTVAMVLFDPKREEVAP